MKTLHVYNRREIMRRAWAIARQRREEVARRAFDLDVRIVGAKIIHNRPLSEFIAETPVDLGAAQKIAWAEARKVPDAPQGGALIAFRPGALAPMRRRVGRVWPLLIAAARWINQRFISSRAA